MFQESKEGQTHYYKDGCGEPEHNPKWKESKPNEILHPYSTRMYQLRVKDGIYINVLEYPPIGDKKSAGYELEVYLDDETNITGKTMQCRIYTYKEKDLDRWREDGMKIVERLITPERSVSSQDDAGEV